jgi:maleylacetate reductase
VIVRWGLGELPQLLAELGIRRPFLVAGRRWDHLGIDAAARWEEIPSDRIVAPPETDGIVAVGGGSAIDTAKAASAEAGLPLVSVPTTYSGSEWTAFYGVRDRDKKMRGGGGGAQLAAIVYDPELTLELPRAETVGTALNALAHCAEALYHPARNSESDRLALEGARFIGHALPKVVEDPADLAHRTRLLEGAAAAGEALARSGLCLGHAMAQAVGGRYGLPHGAMNALCLPPALRFNEPVAADALARFGDAIEAEAAPGVEALARLGGFERLRDFGVPEAELPEVAEATIVRGGAKANPRPATAAEVAELFRRIY